MNDLTRAYLTLLYDQLKDKTPNLGSPGWSDGGMCGTIWTDPVWLLESAFVESGDEILTNHVRLQTKTESILRRLNQLDDTNPVG